MKDTLKMSEFKNYIASKASCVLPTDKDYKVLKHYVKFQISAKSHRMFSASAVFVFTNIKYMQHRGNIGHLFNVIVTLSSILWLPRPSYRIHGKSFYQVTLIH